MKDLRHLAIQTLIIWRDALARACLSVGAVCAISLWFARLLRRSGAAQPFSLAAPVLVLTQPGFSFLPPEASPLSVAPHVPHSAAQQAKWCCGPRTACRFARQRAG